MYSRSGSNPGKKYQEDVRNHDFGWIISGSGLYYNAMNNKENKKKFTTEDTGFFLFSPVLPVAKKRRTNMIKNYLRIFFRNFTRNKGYSLINILGLTIGMACCLLILLYGQYELSYDRYHEKSGQIYRVCVGAIMGGNEVKSAQSSPPMAKTLIEEYPEVLNAVRIFNEISPLVRYKENIFKENRWFFADASFFDIFTVSFIKGNPKTALTQPGTVVITQSTAKKYFGNENPLGKRLLLDKERDILVTGVVKDVPPNSHFHFDFLASLVSLQFVTQSQQWLGNNVYTYITLKENHPPEKLEAKFPALIRKHVGPQIQTVLGVSYDQLLARGDAYEITLQPITDIHLHSDLDYELEANGNATYVYIFLLIAFAVLLIACFNYMNLSTARSARRAKEVGIRKVLGAGRYHLISQFLADTILMSLFSFLLALIVVHLFLPLFNTLVNKELSINYFGNLFLLPILAAAVLLVGITAGSYPAFYLTSFNPVETLKGNLKSIGKNVLLRNGLVILQFIISIFLLIGTFVVYNQLGYIKNLKLGFRKEQVVVIKNAGSLGQQVETFKHELQQYPNIISVCNTQTLPGKPFLAHTHQLKDSPDEQKQVLWTMWADHDFAETYQIEMSKGRFFSKDRPADSTAIILNETAAKIFALSKPLGREIIFITNQKPETYQVIGVVKDFHFESLHQKIRPLAIKLLPDKQTGEYISVRLTPNNLIDTLALLESKWKKFARGQSFEYVFFDEDIAKLYRPEQVTGQVYGIFSLLAIVIACLGLFGLASFTIEQRTKEIAIRKVIGASTANIGVLLCKESTKWVLMANMIAWPLAYYVMNNWLRNFAYRITIGAEIFFLAGLLALVIALLTISYHIVKAALANPIKGLKYE